MPVYILRAVGTEHTKIGWSDGDPMDRISSLQTATWHDLELLRLIDGPRSIEKWLHRHYADRRIKREWFRFCETMMTIAPQVTSRKRRNYPTILTVPTPEEIEESLKAAGMSPQELCRRAGVAVSTYYRWRSGETSPTLDVCLRIADATPPLVRGRRREAVRAMT